MESCIGLKITKRAYLTCPLICLFRFRTEIPPNVSAEVWIPAKPNDIIEESGEPAARRPGVRLERMQTDYAVFSVESGDFDFSVRPRQ